MLNIETYGADILRAKAVAVERVDDEIRALAREMLEAMHAENGIGLAAEQVGRREAICVVDVPVDLDLDSDNRRLNLGIDMPLVLINPEITSSSDDSDVCEEGCLSFPGVSLPIRRPTSISVKYTDLQGDNNEISVTGLVARAIQHEMDHLEGVLIIDRTPKIKRLAVAGRIKKLKERSRRKDPVLC